MITTIVPPLTPAAPTPKTTTALWDSWTYRNASEWSTLIRKQIKKLHKLDYLPPAPLPKEENLAGTDGIFVPFTEQIQDRMKEIKVQKED